MLSPAQRNELVDVVALALAYPAHVGIYYSGEGYTFLRNYDFFGFRPVVRPNRSAYLDYLERSGFTFLFTVERYYMMANRIGNQC